MMLKIIFCSIIFSILIMFISNMIMMKFEYNMYKMSAFECGFLSFSKLHFPFSIRFFLIALIFLIFDIEIIFIFPYSMNQTMLNFSYYSFIILLFFIIYGLIHEWYIGSLNWNY